MIADIATIVGREMGSIRKTLFMMGPRQFEEEAVQKFKKSLKARGYQWSTDTHHLARKKVSSFRE